MGDITISVEEYEKLKDDSAMLNSLHAGGVDNWEFYEESLKEYNKQKEQKEKLVEFLDELFVTICENIDEPAGCGCGYGINESGQHEVKGMLEKFLIKHNQT